MTLYNDSEHVQDFLQSLNPQRIRVIRHPKNLVFYWSHHEKSVIIDRQVVMMGGLDLAWGRWDDAKMHLFDYTANNSKFPGIDFYNPFKKEFIKVR